MLTTIRPSALIDAGAQLGDGCRVWHFVHISAGARIGARCSFGQNVYVGNDVTIGDNVKVQNNVSVYDAVTLDEVREVAARIDPGDLAVACVGPHSADDFR